MTWITNYIRSWIRWPVLWWVIKTFSFPTIILYVLYDYFHRERHRMLRKSLEGKVVLITGASSGLGEALAHTFYKAGCKVILAARREKELEKVRETLLRKYRVPSFLLSYFSDSVSPIYPPVVLPMDLSDLPSIVKQADKALSIFGFIDILINNAGISYRGSVVNTNVDVDWKLLTINYLGPVALTKAILPKMVQNKKGHIVAISSVQGLIAIPYRSAYTASKHALQAFHDSLRAEVSRYNIKVTVLSPGYINTNLSINALTGSGETYGVMDENTAKGMEPSKLAETLLNVVIHEQNEAIVASLPSRLAIILRYTVPNLYFWIMKKRAEENALRE